jgi:hypothetical protein
MQLQLELQMNLLPQPQPMQVLLLLSWNLPPSKVTTKQAQDSWKYHRFQQ